ncbi:MAG TPA: hypothetical protein EYQ54_20080 [Myxococcales bacterium]|nr:hypothetical protein [Myxococcales bacterium]
MDAHPDKRATEAVALGLRAEELAAGLDAWTGGWFSRALAGEAGIGHSSWQLAQRPGMGITLNP